MYQITIQAPDGVFKSKYKTLAKALDYMLYQSGISITNYYSYACGRAIENEIDFIHSNGGARIVDNYGRVITLSIKGV
jgi:hypothetical protein